MSKDTNTLPAAMSAHEKRAVGIIALIAMFRMFGLFALLPVLSPHAGSLEGATPLLIGLAVGAVQALAPGVYVAMNGTIFKPSEVVKNRERNRFEPTGSIETRGDSDA